MRSPLVTPTQERRSCKVGDNKKKSLGERKLSDIFKRKTSSSSGSKGDKMKYRVTSHVGLSPLITPSPRRSPRLLSKSPYLYTLSPLLDNQLFINTDANYQNGNTTYAPSEQVPPQTNLNWRDEYEGQSCAQKSLDFNPKTPVRPTCELLRRDEPIPHDVAERHLKIAVRTGLRDMSDLAAELNAKATVNTVLNYSRSANQDKDTRRPIKKKDGLKRVKSNEIEMRGKKQVKKGNCSYSSICETEGVEEYIEKMSKENLPPPASIECSAKFSHRVFKKIFSNGNQKK